MRHGRPLEELLPGLLYTLRHRAYSAQSERRFHAIVNALRVSAAEAANIGSGVHDDIGDGRIPAMTCSDSRPPTPKLAIVASFPVEPRANAERSAAAMTFASSLPRF